jgi:hypothetical protein
LGSIILKRRHSQSLSSYRMVPKAAVWALESGGAQPSSETGKSEIAP